MGCDSRGMQISRNKQSGGNYWDEKEQKGLQHLNACLKGSLYPFQLISASRPPVLVFAQSIYYRRWPCLSPHISAVPLCDFWNNAWPTLSWRLFFWQPAWNYSATASWWGKLFKNQEESFSPPLPRVRAVRCIQSFSSIWHMWQSGIKMCAVIFNRIAFKKRSNLRSSQPHFH